MIKIRIGGSPCTYWSIARTATNSPITRETENKGMGWELFKNYAIALDKFQPDLWLYENVASMSRDIKASITANLGCDPYLINGALVSAAERETVLDQHCRRNATRGQGPGFGRYHGAGRAGKVFLQYPI
jgi:DNA (cytosine-5)-methyltransferase 3A